MLFADFSGGAKLARRTKGSLQIPVLAYLMDGGTPAGINIPTGDEGCRTNSTKISTTTMHGNSRTTPRGMEMLELPFNRSGRRKNASLDVTFFFEELSFTSSITGSGGAEGILLRTLCTKPIDAIPSIEIREKSSFYKGAGGLEVPRRKSLTGLIEIVQVLQGVIVIAGLNRIEHEHRTVCTGLSAESTVV